MNIRLTREDGKCPSCGEKTTSHGVQLTDEVAIGGFTSQSDAAIWVLEYIFRMMSEGKRAALAQQREEVRKAILGAALLAPKTEKSKQ